MQYRYHRWIVWVLLLIFIQLSALPANFKILFNETNFLLESVMQVLAADVDADQQKEILVTGKNYTGRELFVYCLEFESNTLSFKWRSDNLFEERSILWSTLGNFDGRGEQLAVLTNSRTYLYQLTPANLQLLRRYNNEFEPLAVTAADLDGDGVTELLIAKVGKVTAQAYNCVVEIWKLGDHQLEKVYQSDLLGNIRGLAAGDLDHDNQVEIVVEEGLRLTTGNLRIYNYTEGRLVEKTKFRLNNNGAIYALKVRSLPEGRRLITGSVQGKINLLALTGGKVTATVPELALKSSLIDLEVADLNGDGRLELITASYPRKVQILSYSRNSRN